MSYKQHIKVSYGRTGGIRHEEFIFDSKEDANRALNHDWYMERMKGTRAGKIRLRCMDPVTQKPISFLPFISIPKCSRRIKGTSEFDMRKDAFARTHAAKPNAAVPVALQPTLILQSTATPVVVPTKLAPAQAVFNLMISNYPDKMMEFIKQRQDEFVLFCMK